MFTKATMRAKLIVLLILAGAVLPMGPARAAELFRAGVLSCVSLSRAVTAMSLDRCYGGQNRAKREMFGSCVGSYVSHRTRVPFVVSAYVREMRHYLPDNKKPLRFDYRGVRCQLKTWRLRSVHNCSKFAGGNGMACQVCIFLFGKHCYDARMVVTPRSRTARR